MSLDDGLVLQIHPGSWRNHSPAMLRDVRPRQGLRHPDPHRLRRGAEAAARLRSAREPNLTIIALHARRDQLCARAGAAGRRLSGAEARPGLVVPRQPGGHAPLPRDDHRDRRLLQHRRLQRRHPRLLLDPGPPRRGAPGRLRLPRAPRRRTSPARRTRRTSLRRTSPIRSRKRRTGSNGQQPD